MNSLMVKSARLQALGVAVRLLWEAPVDLDDAAETEAYYSSANVLMAAIIAAPARTFADAQVKAEAVAWCCASRTDFGLGHTSSERVIHSLLTDLLYAAPSDGGTRTT